MRALCPALLRETSMQSAPVLCEASRSLWHSCLTHAFSFALCVRVQVAINPVGPSAASNVFGPALAGTVFASCCPTDACHADLAASPLACVVCNALFAHTLCRCDLSLQPPCPIACRSGDRCRSFSCPLPLSVLRCVRECCSLRGFAFVGILLRDLPASCVARLTCSCFVWSCCSLGADCVHQRGRRPRQLANHAHVRCFLRATLDC